MTTDDSFTDTSVLLSKSYLFFDSKKSFLTF